MAITNNITSGNNIVVANTDANFSLFTTENTVIIRSVVNGNYISYQPGRTINSLTAIQNGKGYIVTSKIARSLPIFDPTTGNGAVFSKDIF